MTSKSDAADRSPEPGSRWAENPQRDHEWICEPVGSEVRGFHRSLTGYAPTGLIDLPDLAGELGGVGHVLAKDESNRFGLPAFKALGASWAIHRALLDRFGDEVPQEPVTMVTASDGNHGRAVAHFARLLGQRAAIFVPDGVHPTAIQAIRDEGATVTAVPGSYDSAVEAAAHHAESGEAGRRLLVQDTAWEGYEEVPGWIVDGYSTLFKELDEQLAALDVASPDLVVVPSGVGSLLQSAITHYRSRPSPTSLVSVEPVKAACVLASVERGKPTTVDTGSTVMAGMNCGTMSSLAWPHISRGLDAAVAVTDGEAVAAARELRGRGVDAGPCAGAGLAAVRVALDHELWGREAVERHRSLLGLSPEATIILLVTEGVDANPWLDGGWDD